MRKFTKVYYNIKFINEVIYFQNISKDKELKSQTLHFDTKIEIFYLFYQIYTIKKSTHITNLYNLLYFNLKV